MAGSACAGPRRERIGGIMHCGRLTRIGVMHVPDRPGVAAEVFGTLGDRGINTPFIVQSIELQGYTNIIICVASADAAAAMEALQDLQPSLNAAAYTQEAGMALVSVFGPDFRERPGIAGIAFGALAKKKINILAISTSISTISCLLRQEDLAEARQALEEAFALP